MSAELLFGRYISSLLVGLLRKTMNFSVLLVYSCQKALFMC